MPQSFTSFTAQSAVLKTTLTRPDYCLKDYLLEEGLTLRHMLLHDAGTETFRILLKANIEEDDYFFAYCPDSETASLLSAYYHNNVAGPVKRFFYSSIKGNDNTILQREILVFIINSKWIRRNYNCTADAFATYINMLPVLFNIADNPNLMKIDVLFYLRSIKETVNQHEQGSGLRLRVNVLSLIEKFFSSADFGAANADTKKHSYVKEMHELGGKLSMFLKTNLPDLIIFAREYNMSLSSLKRHFKNVHGKPIYEYYLEQKMKLAKNIIQTSSRSVSQVAYELGYEDPKGLIKSFKKVYGMPPGKLCA